MVAEPVCELGETRYWYRRDGRTIGKSVALLPVLYVEGTSRTTTTRSRRSAGCPSQEARAALSHAAEREMVALAVAYLEKDR